MAITLSVIFCFYTILDIWDKRQQKPVIVSFDDKISSIKTIPFPAVTVCSSENYDPQKVDMHKLVNVLQSIGNGDISQLWDLNNTE